LYLSGIDPTMARADGEQHLEAVRRFVRAGLLAEFAGEPASTK